MSTSYIKSIGFAFFYSLTKKGYAVLNKDPQFIGKYIITPILNKFKPYNITSYYLHKPGLKNGQLSMQFDLQFENFKYIDYIPQVKSYIEKRVEEGLKKYGII